MSGWGKATAVGSTATVYEGEKPYFGMLAAVYYTGVSGEEWHFIPFSKDYTDWQFASGIVVPKQDKPVKMIKVYLIYKNNGGTAYFDNISLTKEPCSSYTYDDKGNPVSAKEGGAKTNCEYQSGTSILTKYTASTGVTSSFTYAPTTHKVTLGEIVELLDLFKKQPQTLLMPEIPYNSFAKKLYSTYLSYLPAEKTIFDLKMNKDERGSFTELLKTLNCGQFSVNISKPGITKGEHWHNSKWEFFIVVAGHGLIQERRIGTDEVREYEVSGEKIQAVQMLPGFTHNIINLSQTENLVTVMWANEQFDAQHPDTFGEKVEAEHE